LLVQDNVRYDVDPCPLDEVQSYFRLAPYRAERIVSQKQAYDGLVHTVASEDQIACLGHGARGSAHELDCGRDRLRPKGSYSHRVVDLRPIGDEAMLLY
jgi:hypothetical protein